MGTKQLDDSWKGWLIDNISRGCSPEELVDILLKNHFAIDSIRQNMGEKFPANSSILTTPAPILPDYYALANVKLTKMPLSSSFQKLDYDKLQLYIMDDFLSESECDSLNQIINATLRKSTVTISSGDKYYRTSSTSDLALLDNAFVKQIDKKIGDALGINITYSEGIQAQKYETGQEFKEHTDFFEPFTEEYEQFAKLKGNRTWTFMIYLTNVTKGGGTQFFSAGRIFIPKKGRAVIWNNLNEDGSVNRFSNHAGMPVEEGEKIIITKWFREKGFGEMFV